MQRSNNSVIDASSSSNRNSTRNSNSNLRTPIRTPIASPLRSGLITREGSVAFRTPERTIRAPVRTPNSNIRAERANNIRNTRANTNSELTNIETRLEEYRKLLNSGEIRLDSIIFIIDYLDRSLKIIRTLTVTNINRDRYNAIEGEINSLLQQYRTLRDRRRDRYGIIGEDLESQNNSNNSKTSEIESEFSVRSSNGGGIKKTTGNSSKILSRKGEKKPKKITKKIYGGTSSNINANILTLTLNRIEQIVKTYRARLNHPEIIRRTITSIIGTLVGAEYLLNSLQINNAHYERFYNIQTEINNLLKIYNEIRETQEKEEKAQVENKRKQNSNNSNGSEVLVNSNGGGKKKGQNKKKNTRK